jgi:hypothetical protein
VRSGVSLRVSIRPQLADLYRLVFGIRLQLRGKLLIRAFDTNGNNWENRRRPPNRCTMLSSELGIKYYVRYIRVQAHGTSVAVLTSLKCAHNVIDFISRYNVIPCVDRERTEFRETRRGSAVELRQPMTGDFPIGHGSMPRHEPYTSRRRTPIMAIVVSRIHVVS